MLQVKKLTTLLLALCVIALTGCSKPTPEERQQKQQRLQERENVLYRDYLHTVDYNGHSYIIYEGRYKGGITHNPDCPCRESSAQPLCSAKKGGTK